jgi:hypothetical protein
MSGHALPDHDEIATGCAWLGCMLVLIAGGMLISLVLLTVIVARACRLAC